MCISLWIVWIMWIKLSTNTNVGNSQLWEKYYVTKLIEQLIRVKIVLLLPKLKRIYNNMDLIEGLLIVHI